jgi:hypothetical protein
LEHSASLLGQTPRGSDEKALGKMLRISLEVDTILPDGRRAWPRRVQRHREVGANLLGYCEKSCYVTVVCIFRNRVLALLRGDSVGKGG